MSVSADRRPSSLSTAGYTDGLGRRSLRFDREVGGMLEELEVRPELALYEPLLRQSSERLARVTDPRILPVKGIDRQGRSLVVLSTASNGQRLEELIDARSAEEFAAPGIDAALGFLVRVGPPLASLHAGGLVHGCLGPGRVSVGAGGEVTLTDVIYAPALERLGMPRQRLWTSLGVAAPPSAGPARFDRANDVRQVLLSAVAIALGRPLADVPGPDHIQRMLLEVAEVALIRGGDRFAADVDRLFSPAAIGIAPPTIAQVADQAQRLAGILGTDGCFEALAGLTRIQLEPAERPQRPQPALHDPSLEAPIIVVPPPAERADADHVRVEEFDRVSFDAVTFDTLDVAEEHRPLEAQEDDPFDVEAPAEPAAEMALDVADSVEISLDGFDESSTADFDPDEPVLLSEAPGDDSGLFNLMRTPDAFAVRASYAEPADVWRREEEEPAPVILVPDNDVAADAADFHAPPVESVLAEPLLDEPVFAGHILEPTPPTPPSEPMRAASPEAEPPSLTDVLAGAGPDSVVLSPSEGHRHQPEEFVPAPAAAETFDAPAPVSAPVVALPAPIPAPTPAPPPGIRLARPATQPPEPTGKLEPPARSGPRLYVPPPPVTPPVPVPTPPVPFTPPAPITVVVAQEAAAPAISLRLKTDDVGFTRPARMFSETAPEDESARRTRGWAPRLPWKILGAASVVIIVAAFAGRTFLAGKAEAPRAAEPAPAAAVTTPPPAAPVLSKGGGGLTIETQPAGAAVLLDGEDVGRTPLTLTDVKPGRHTLTLSTESATVKRTVRIEAGKIVTLDVPVYSGWVAIYSPIPLLIAEGNRTLGSTETTRVMLSPGRHELTLTNRELGYTSKHAVEIAAGEERVLNVEPKGSVSVNALPWAEVWVDGTRMGETPLANLQVALGTREFVFRHPTHGERRVTATITSNAPPISVDFSRQ